MIIWEYLIEISILISLFFGSLKIQEIVYSKTSEQSSAFRALTQSLLQKNKPSKIKYTYRKVNLTHKSNFVPSMANSIIYINGNYYYKKFLDDKKIRPKFLSEKGEINILSSMIFFLLIVATFFIVLSEFRHTRLTIERKEHYLCLKSILKENYEYTKQMGHLNKIIAINYPLQFNPKTGPAHKAVINASKIMQEMLTKKFKLSFLTNPKSCTKGQRMQLSPIYHYQTIGHGILLKRDPIGQGIPRDRSINIRLFGKNTSSDIFKIQFQPLNYYKPVKSVITPTFNIIL